MTAQNGTMNGGDSFSTAAITPGAGTNRAMFVGIAYYHAPETAVVTSVVFNAGTPQNLTNACAAYKNPDDSRYVTIWRLANPTNESATVTVNFTASANVFAVAHALVFTGVDQTTTFDGCSNANNENTTISNTVTTASGSMVMDIAQTTNGAGAPSVGANQTSRGTAIDGDTVVRGVTSTQAGADGGAMTWTITSARWTSQALNIRKAP